MAEFIVNEDFHADTQGRRELIRCKDCRHSGLYCSDKYGELYECYRHETTELEVHKADWFCADGEPKE